MQNETRSLPAADADLSAGVTSPSPSSTGPSNRQDPADVVVRAEGVVKRYGATTAVDGVDLTVRRGEIFGLLGQNGAGKTTTVECIAGLRRPDEGRIRVLGFDPTAERDRDELRRRVGVQLQDSQLPDGIRVGEALELYAKFYPDPADPAELGRQLGLADHWRKPYGKLSGGQQQRLSIALALLGQPEIAILDELTTGLDPHARRRTWSLVERVRDRGVTVLLVTHFMDEAERLCDRLAVIDAGCVAACGSPQAVIDQVAGEPTYAGGSATGHRPTLEDAFVHLTGGPTDA